MRRPVLHVAHPHGRQRDPHARGDLVPRQAEIQRAEGDVLTDGGHEQLVVRVLEHEPDRGAQLADVADAGHVERAVTGQQAVQVQHQRRLAGAVGSEHGDPLALRHRQIDAVEPDDSVRVAVPQSAGDDHDATSASTRSGTSVSTSALRNTASVRRNASTDRRGIVPA